MGSRDAEITKSSGLKMICLRKARQAWKRVQECRERRNIKRCHEKGSCSKKSHTKISEELRNGRIRHIADDRKEYNEVDITERKGTSKLSLMSCCNGVEVPSEVIVMDMAHHSFIVEHNWNAATVKNYAFPDLIVEGFDFVEFPDLMVDGLDYLEYPALFI